MKNLKLVSHMALTALFLFLGGCQKEEKFDKEITPDQSKFLNSSIYDFKEISNQIIAKTDTRSEEFISNLNGIKAKLLELDNRFGLFTKIVNNYGFPIWDRPLISANYGNAKYVYYFPLIHGSNDLINGYFKVIYNDENRFTFFIINESQIQDKIANDNMDSELLYHYGIMQELNIDIFGKSRSIYNSGLKYFLSINDTRILPRSGCWDDVLVSFDSHVEKELIYIEMSSDPVKRREQFFGGFQSYITVSHLIINPRYIQVWNSDCGGNDNDIDWVPESNGGSTTQESTWVTKQSENLAFIQECMQTNIGDEGTNTDPNDIGPGSTSWQGTPSEIDKCTIIKKLKQCGVSDQNNAFLITAQEMGFIKDFRSLLLQSCNNTYMNEAIDKYRNCLIPNLIINAGTIGPILPFQDYLNAIRDIREWEASHNDLLSSQIAEDMIASLCGPIGGNANTVNVEILEAKYIHETLKVNYSDYNLSNVNIDALISIYGVEKYFAATALYSQMRVNGINVSWIDIEARFKNWYIDNIDSGQEYLIAGGFDWSKHSPVSNQLLPSYSGFYGSYPRDENGKLLTKAVNIFGLLNGPIKDVYENSLKPGNTPITNVCALKVSIALNGAGVTIPHIFQDNNSNGSQDPGESSFTIPDDNGLYYFLNAELLINYMLTVFPSPTVTVTATNIDINGATPESSFGTDNGIYGMLPVSATAFGASGHCDIWLPVEGAFPPYNECGAGCHWGYVDVSYFWKLD